MTHYYIATSLSRASVHQQLRDLLASRGHHLTYDWTSHGSVKQTSTERLQQVATIELKGVAAADLLIVLLPGGIGTHTELGAALGSNTPVIIHSEDPNHFLACEKTCAFYHHPLVTQVCCPLDQLDSVVHAIENIALVSSI